MKRLSTVSVITASLLIFSGCGEVSPQVAKQKFEMSEKSKNIQSIKNLPQWVINPQSKDGITAVGMSAYSRHGIRVMKPQAEMDARAKLAGQIETIVSRSQKQAMRSVQIADTDDMENLFSQSTKEVIKQIPLSGAVVVNQTIMDNGDYYVQMTIKKREVLKELDNQQEVYKKNLENSKLSHENIENGMKVLDNMMKKLEEDI
ncbi:MAG: LPP20 family lipoprotein [Campylobacterales bacterium]